MCASVCAGTLGGVLMVMWEAGSSPGRGAGGRDGGGQESGREESL